MKLRTLALAALSAAGLVLGASAQPALATTTECSHNERKIVLPQKPDVTIQINLCVVRDGPDIRAYTSIAWNESYNFLGGTRFNDFDLTLRIERYDDVRLSKTYDVKGLINTKVSGGWNYPAITLSDRPSGGWSADGVVRYDVTDDGLGDAYWNLTGSPRVS